MGFLANYVRNCVSLAARRQPRRPLLFSYYVTHRCPLACRYCSDGQGRPFKDDVVEELPTDRARQLIDLLRRDCDTLDITGGEPLLRADLEDLLAHARKIGFRTVLNTKGPGLSHRPDVMRLSSVLVLSVDSLDADRLGRIVGGPSRASADILDALHWAVENRARHKTQLVLSAVAMPDNLDDVSDVLRFCIQHRLGFQLSPQIVGTQVHPGLRGNQRFRSLLDEAIAAKDSGAGVLGVGRYLRGIRDGRPYTCHPLLMPTLRPDGTMNLPCLERPRERVDLLAAGSYERALKGAGGTRPPEHDCQDGSRVPRLRFPAAVPIANAPEHGCKQRSRGTRPPRECEGQCHIFCHMALSLLQRHPLAALGELRAWRSQSC